jgi:chromosome segregation ATPase
MTEYSETMDQQMADQAETHLSVGQAIGKIATNQQATNVKVDTNASKLETLETRIEQLESVLEKTDAVLHKLDPTMVDKLLMIVEKWYPHGA